MFIFVLQYFSLAAELDDPFLSYNVWARDGSDKMNFYNISDTFYFSYIGEEDYSVTPTGYIRSVSSGDKFRLSLTIQAEKVGKNGISFSCVTYDSSGNVVSWTYKGGSVTDVSNDFVSYESEEFFVPYGVTSLVPRIIGYEQTTFAFKNYKLEKTGSTPVEVNASEYSISNDVLNFSLSTILLNFTIHDKRNDRKWYSESTTNTGMTLTKVINSSNQIELRVQLDNEKDECAILYTLNNSDEIDFNIYCPPSMNITYIRYPFYIESSQTDRIIIPLNEGFSFMANDFSHGNIWSNMQGGHGLCMSFMGLYDDTDFNELKSGMMLIIQTPNDFEVSFTNSNGVQNIQPFWYPEMGKFGYNRSIKYVFFDKAKHVELCKRYRQYVRENTNYLFTFEEKKKKYPTIEFDKLIGAANIWYFGDQNKVDIYTELQSLGIDKMIVGSADHKDNTEILNQREPSVLTSRYDNYQDILDPDLNQWVNNYGEPDEMWVEAWPKDIVWADEAGNYLYSWALPNISNSSQMISEGVLCDKQAINYARKSISADLKSNKYKCRFIDTTTASSWRECYNPAHKMTKTESVKARLELLNLLHEEFNIVSGSETGVESAVPYCDYFEGMMSLGPYRVPDSGRNIEQIWENGFPQEIPENIPKFQLGHDYRLPLFELVYHDCLVSYWYWGDHSFKIPIYSKKRDLFNMLYGVPPMYLFTDANFDQLKEDVAKSYAIASPISQKTGYSEMIDFIILSQDRNVQQSVFANNVTVICNFGQSDFKLADGSIVPSMSAVEKQFSADVVPTPKKNKTGMIVGIVIGVVVVVAIIVIVIVFVVYKKRQNPSDSNIKI